MLAVGALLQACSANPDKLAAEGSEAYTNGDYSRAVELLQEAADKGSAAGELWLGRCYSTGHGVPASEKRAYELYKSASEKGNADATMELALCYMSGKGTIGDVAKGRALMEESAQSGSKAGQATMANWALDGKIALSQDSIIAYANRSADAKVPEASMPRVACSKGVLALSATSRLL